MANQRLAFAKKLTVGSKELAAEEARYFATLPEHAQKVFQRKRLLPFKKLLVESGCPDLDAGDVMAGLDLVGDGYGVTLLRH